LTTGLEEIVVLGTIKPQGRDWPAGACGQLFSHAEWHNRVEPTVDDQGWTTDFRDLLHVSEPVPK
jgi:hypothetical protein